MSDCSHGKNAEAVFRDYGESSYIRCHDCQRVALLRNRTIWYDSLRALDYAQIYLENRVALDPDEPTYSDLAVANGVSLARWIPTPG